MKTEMPKTICVQLAQNKEGIFLLQKFDIKNVFDGGCNYVVYSEYESLRRENEKLKAKLEKAKWQPIDTAPKDGTVIDIWTTNRGRIVNVAWTLDDFDGTYYWGCENGGVYEPTHWMLLPDEPEQL